MIVARRYTDRIILYSKTEALSPFGRPITTYTLQGTYPCDVEELSGYRSMVYQQAGIKNPLSIEMRQLSFTPAYGIWEGREVVISSIVKDKRNRKVVIEGSAKEFTATTTHTPTTTVAPTTLSPTTTV